MKRRLATQQSMTRRTVLVAVVVVALLGLAGVAYAAFSGTTASGGNSLTAAAAFPGYRDEVMSDNPAAYWRLGETSGTTADDQTANNNDGTYAGAPALGQAGALLDDGDKAVGFDGVNDQVSVPDSASLDVGDVMSVEAWFKRSSTGGADTILEKGNGAYKLTLTTANRVRFRRPGVADIVDSTITITDTNTWHHVVVTKNGATVKLYIDGVDRTGTVTNSTLVNSADPVTIGNNSTTERFDGYLDDVAVYATALSAARVKAHYRAGQPYAGEVVDDGPAAYWRLGEASGTTAVDRVGTNNGTYTNGPTLGQTGALTGDPDTAVSFNGTNEYVSVPDSASLDLGDVLSIEAWIKRAATSQDDAILDKGGNGYKLYLRATDNTLVLRKNGVGDIVASTSAITDTTSWHHVVGTKNGATSKLYIDGIDVTGTVTNQTIANNANNLIIGDNGGGSQYFNGLIDEVALYGTALTADMVREHYYRGP